MIESIDILGVPNWQVEKAIKTLKIHPTLRCLLSILLEFRNPKDELSIFPTVKLLATRMSLGRAQTRRYLKKLEEAGYLRIRDCFLKGDVGKQGANCYILMNTILKPELLPNRPVSKPRLSIVLGGSKGDKKKSLPQVLDECQSPMFYTYNENGRRVNSLSILPFKCNPPRCMSRTLNLDNTNNPNNILSTPNCNSYDGSAAERSEEVRQTQDSSAYEILAAYESKMGQKISPLARTKFELELKKSGFGTEKCLGIIDEIANCPILKPTTSSPNRIFHIFALRASRDRLLSSIRTITEGHKRSLIGFSPNRWSMSILELNVEGRWHFGTPRGILDAASRSQFRCSWQDLTSPSMPHDFEIEEPCFIEQEKPRIVAGLGF